MRDTLVLCYHAVSDRWDDALAVTPARLREQVGWLVDRGYRGITFTEAVDRPAGRTVAVTFDDAYRSVATLAAPVLAELGVPGTVFAPTDHVGREAPMAWPGIDHIAAGPHGDELVPCSWDELASLAEAGWEVGSHTRSHPRLPEVGDDERLDDELAGSRAVLAERLGRPCTSLAYPYGAFDARVAEAAARAGYRIAGVLDRRAGRTTPMTWPRVGVYGADTPQRFRLKVNAALRSPVGGAALVGAKRLRRLGRPAPEPAHAS